MGLLEASWATGSLTLSKYSDDVERGTVTLLPWGDPTPGTGRNRAVSRYP